MTHATKPKFITKRAFVAYLKAHRKALFTPRTCHDCPLSRASGHVVGSTRYGPLGSELMYPLPSWAVTFLRAFDEFNAITDGATALTCLASLGGPK